MSLKHIGTSCDLRTLNEALGMRRIFSIIIEYGLGLPTGTIAIWGDLVLGILTVDHTFNAMSLLPKIEEPHLASRNSHAAVIGITETWLYHSVTDPEIIERSESTETKKGVVYVCIFEPAWHLTNRMIFRMTNWRFYGLNCFSHVLDLF